MNLSDFNDRMYEVLFGGDPDVTNTGSNINPDLVNSLLKQLDKIEGLDDANRENYSRILNTHLGMNGHSKEYQDMLDAES